MRPFLFHIGSTGVPAFFFMIMIGSLAATYVAAKIAKHEGLSEIAVLDMAIIMIVASMIGSRLVHVLVEAPDYYWERPIRIFFFWQGGFVSLGAFIGSILSAWAYLRIKKLNVARYLDVMAGAVPVIIFFVRWGCFLNGCCYGKETTHWPYVVFTNPSSTACLMHYCNKMLHPTQMYFAANATLMFIVLLLVRKHRKFYGQVGAVFLMYEGFSRFFIEFFRGDEDRGIWFNGLLSTGQIVMVGFFAAGIIMWWMCSRKRVLV